MDSHQRQIHFHLARAIMHLNYIAGFLPFFETDLDWDASTLPSGPSMTMPSPGFTNGSRNLHTFVPLSRRASSASLVTHVMEGFLHTWSSTVSLIYDQFHTPSLWTLIMKKYIQQLDRFHPLLQLAQPTAQHHRQFPQLLRYARGLPIQLYTTLYNPLWHSTHSQQSQASFAYNHPLLRPPQIQWHLNWSRNWFRQ